MAAGAVARYIGRMKRGALHLDQQAGDGASEEAGYAAWKRAKIEKGLAQCADRDAMIPVEQVWQDFKLER